MKIILVLCLFMIGCDGNDFRTEYKCVDGVIYVKSNGAWIQALIYKDNKCLAVKND